MGLDIEKTPRRSEKVVFRKIENEYILVPIISTSDDAESIFNLNETGAVIWDKVDGSRTIGDIIDDLLDEYDAEPQAIRRDVTDFLSDLAECRLVEVI